MVPSTVSLLLPDCETDGKSHPRAPLHKTGLVGPSPLQLGWPLLDLLLASLLPPLLRCTLPRILLLSPFYPMLAEPWRDFLCVQSQE